MNRGETASAPKGAEAARSCVLTEVRPDGQVVYLLSILLPMSTTARIIAAISSNEHYFKDYWRGTDGRAGWSRLQAEAEAFLVILSARDCDLHKHLVDMLGQGALREVVLGWFAPLLLPLVPLSRRRVRPNAARGCSQALLGSGMLGP